MERVEGVRSVKIDFDSKTATVVFDPILASPEAIAAASTNVGYPAKSASGATFRQQSKQYSPSPVQFAAIRQPRSCQLTPVSILTSAAVLS